VRLIGLIYFPPFADPENTPSTLFTLCNKTRSIEAILPAAKSRFTGDYFLDKMVLTNYSGDMFDPAFVAFPSKDLLGRLSAFSGVTETSLMRDQEVLL
jgi:hypothetical protein